MPFDEAMRFEALRAIKPPMALVLKMTYNSRHVPIGNFENLRRKKASLLLELGADQTSEDGGSSDVDVGGCEDGDGGDGDSGNGGIGGGVGVGGGGGGGIHRDATRFIMEVES
ncbi:hypothetical protein V1477_019708 [Vespula maculifrons]|uniref:Uncharacterized protein n=1 Tax=Vespula maculifrons TaxID=7453 RepID=A0ABD2AR71_VESMC